MRDPVAGPAAGPPPPRVAVLVLAAGRSLRMGRPDKLLAALRGRALVVWAIESALASRARPVVVVTGHGADRLRAVAATRGVRFVHNPRYAEGLGSSLAAGVTALDPEVDAVLVCLGDMPRVRADHLDALIAAFEPGVCDICVPVHSGRRGHPVLFGRRHFGALARLAGDAGARVLLERHAGHLREVPVPDDGVLLDVDTPEDLARS